MKNYIKFRILSLLIATLCLFSTQVNATIRYVAPLASSAWAGQTVYNDIPAAIAAAATDDEIWIASGTYDISATITYDVAKNLKFYGSFEGTETAIEQRAKVTNGKEWEFSNPTILKMAAAGTCINVNNAAITATFDGITIDGNSVTGTRGMWVNNATVVTISHCIVKNNNIDLANGAGILGTKKIIVEYCLIDNNKSSKIASGAKWGSGICIVAANSSVKYSLISNNTKTNDSGGGIGVDNVAGVVVSDCQFINNTTGNSGGGLCAYRIDDIHNCFFSGNSATGSGGGIYQRAYAGSGVIYNSIIVNNTSTGIGGGIYIGSQSNVSNVKTYNCIIANNTGSDAGVSVANATTTPAQIINCVLYNNKKSSDGTVSNIAVAGTNNIFKNNIIDNAAIANLTQTSCIIETDAAKLFTDIANSNYAPPATGFAGLDKGDNTALTFANNTDFSGVARTQGTAIEIGAYELVPAKQVVNLNLGTGVSSSTSSTSEVNMGDPVTIDFTLGSGYHSPYVSVNNTCYAYTESAGTYSVTIPSVTATQDITISAFAANMIPVTIDTWTDHLNPTTLYDTNKSLEIRNADAGYSNRRSYLRFDIPAYVKTNYNSATLKLYNGNATDRDNTTASVRTVTTTISELANFSSLNWNASGATTGTFDGTEVALLSPVVMKSTVENTQLSVDLSEYVLGQLETTNTINIQIATNTDGYLHLKSWENGNANYVPVLEFEEKIYSDNSYVSTQGKISISVADGFMTIKNMNTPDKVQIFDISGRKLYEEKTNNHLTLINYRLNKGLYVVKTANEAIKIAVR